MGNKICIKFLRSKGEVLEKHVWGVRNSHGCLNQVRGNSWSQSRESNKWGSGSGTPHAHRTHEGTHARLRARAVIRRRTGACWSLTKRRRRTRSFTVPVRALFRASALLSASPKYCQALFSS